MKISELYFPREETVKKVKQLKGQVQNEANLYESEFKEIQRRTEHERRLNKFMEAKLHIRSAPGNIGKGGMRYSRFFWLW